MALTDAEFTSILRDSTKCINGDIVWREDMDHSPAWEFRAKVASQDGWPIFVKGRYNRDAGTLTYVLILKTEGRIYALDMGKDHRNPQGDVVGDKHKHRWSEAYRDKEAYVPDDLTAPVSDPVAVWTQFCDEARIRHNGKLSSPPPHQLELDFS